MRRSPRCDARCVTGLLGLRQKKRMQHLLCFISAGSNSSTASLSPTQVVPRTGAKQECEVCDGGQRETHYTSKLSRVSLIHAAWCCSVGPYRCGAVSSSVFYLSTSSVESFSLRFISFGADILWHTANFFRSILLKTAASCASRRKKKTPL